MKIQISLEFLQPRIWLRLIVAHFLRILRRCGRRENTSPRRRLLRGASFAFAAERMTRFQRRERERVYRSSSTSLVKLSRRDYDVIQVEARRSGPGCYHPRTGTARIYWERREWEDRRGRKQRRISESVLTVINPLNKVIEDSRGSVEVNLRRL